MKTTDLVVIGLAGVAVLLILKTTKSTGQTQAKGNTNKNWVDEILNASGEKFSNGWRYFNDGTAIDPYGRYLKDGQVVWSP